MDIGDIRQGRMKIRWIPNELSIHHGFRQGKRLQNRRPSASRGIDGGVSSAIELVGAVCPDNDIARGWSLFFCWSSFGFSSKSTSTGISRGRLLSIRVVVDFCGCPE